jgi:hypothetical protein
MPMLSKPPLQPAFCFLRPHVQLNTVALASGEKPLLSEIERLLSKFGRLELDVTNKVCVHVIFSSVAITAG